MKIVSLIIFLSCASDSIMLDVDLLVEETEEGGEMTLGGEGVPPEDGIDTGNTTGYGDDFVTE